jgi:hypothetical protein
VVPRSLGAVVEDRRASLDPELALLQRREPVRLVLGGVALGADAEEPQVKETDRAPEHAVTEQAAQRKIGSDAIAHRRERCGELLHLPELLPIAVLAPRLVVQVLLAAGVVIAGCLDVATRVGADPDVCPGRRDRQRADPISHIGVLDRIVVLIEVREPPAAPDASDARRGAIDPP